MRKALGMRWAILLSGGEGERLRPWVEALYGRTRPKQYCSFLGRRTMLEHAAERAADACGAERLVTVIGAGHARHLSEAGIELPGQVLAQPANRDTAPGVFLPLTYVLARDPEAVVVVFPSDQYIAPKGRFLAHVEKALALAERQENRLVLLGAVPDGPEPDYGWIQAERGGEPGVRSVRRFREKPLALEAAAYYRAGFLWNTLIMAAKAKLLWSLAGELLPAMRSRFEALRRAVGTVHEDGVLDWTYADMRSVNFSTGILEACPERTLVVPLEGVAWSDWGRRERVEETLRRAGKPVPLAAAPAAARLDFAV